MSGGAPDHTTSTTEIPQWAQPYAQSLLQRTGALSDQQMPVYTGARSADMNGYQQAANQMVANRAMNGSAEIQAGSNNLMDTLNGNYLNGNPYLDANVNRAAGQLQRQYQGAVNNTDSTMARAGAFGGSAWQQQQEGNSRQLAQGLTDLNSSMYGQNYANERQNQMNALGIAPTYGNQAYQDAQALQSVGSNQYAYDNQKVQDQMAQWTDFAQSPYKQLDLLGNGIRAAVGGGSTQTQSIAPSNPYATALGGGAALYGLLK